MTAKDYLVAGDLSAAITAATDGVKESPGDYNQRTLLFELLTCAGELDRAAKHLDVIAGESADRAAAVETYRGLLDAERQRRRVFTEGLTPGLPKRVPESLPLYLDAIRLVREQHYAEARALLEKAEESRNPRAVSVNGETFDDLQDADDRLGPFLEVIVTNKYSWIPWSLVESVNIAAPQNFRDLIWIPAQIDLEFGSLGQVFLPALYVDSYLHADPQVKLGRVTDWRLDVPELALASGQKLLTAGDRDWPLLEIRSIEFTGEEESDGVSSAGG